MRVKMRSTTPMRALRRGHEAAGLRQQRDQRHLAQVGRLAGHVRPGEHDDLGVVAVEHGVVGHEAAVAEVALDHRVAAVADLDALRRRRRRAGRSRSVPPSRRGRCRRRSRRSCCATACRPSAEAASWAQTWLEQRRLELADRLARGEDALFELLEARRDEALGADQRLLALEVAPAPSPGSPC